MFTITLPHESHREIFLVAQYKTLVAPGVPHSQVSVHSASRNTLELLFEVMSPVDFCSGWVDLSYDFEFFGLSRFGHGGLLCDLSSTMASRSH